MSENESEVFNKIQDYFNGMLVIYNQLLAFLDEEKDEEANYTKLINSLNQIKIKEDRSKLREFLHLILSISNDHHRTANFFEKIEKILTNFVSEMKNFYSEEEIFNVFKDNFRLIYFLVNEKVINLDSTILNLVKHGQYGQFFMYYFGLEEKLDKREKFIFFEEKNQNGTFKKNQLEGENDILICQLIRNDSIEEFIQLFNSSKLNSNSTVLPSQFETNRFLNMNLENISLIEYAAFFGSIQIFKFLLLQKVVLTSPIWIYAIHGRNYEIIHLLEENNVKMQVNLCISESIKCHHNELTEYLLNNFENSIEKFFLNQSLSCNNYSEIVNYFQNVNNFDKFNLLFNLACKFDYFHICEYILKLQNFDVNKKIISCLCFYVVH